MPNKKIELCFISKYPSVQEGILDVFKISKSQLKKLQIPKNYLAKEIRSKDACSLPINLVNHGMINPQYNGPEVQLILETEFILALSKPEKVHTHPLSYDESDNICSFLRQSGRSVELSINKENYDRGLLYRLDYETSGLILYAKNEELYKQARADLKSVVNSKKYLAVVEGEIKQDELVTSYLKSTGKKGSRVDLSSADDISAKKVECKVRLVEFNSTLNISLVEVELFQGVRHQIRKQLEDIGHPIIGDPLYGNKSGKRMYLHCWQYEISWGTKLKIEDKNFGLLLDFFNFNGES